jgi:uncharacterized iron-regulated protein
MGMVVAQMEGVLGTLLKNHLHLLISFGIFLASVFSTSWAESLGKPLVERLRDRSRMGLSRLTAELRGSPFVMVGELHDEPSHHQFQLSLLESLFEARVPLAIGMEMFQQGVQSKLDAWSMGQMTEEEMENLFGENWSQTSWILYRDILRFARDRRIPVIGLNVPVQWKDSPPSDPGKDPRSSGDFRGEESPCRAREDYLRFMMEAFQAHSSRGERDFESFCRAQISRDLAMAQAMVRFREAHGEVTLVALTGIAHAWVPAVPDVIAQLSGLLTRVILPDLEGRLKEGPLGPEDADYLWLRY